jgi:hypothetical protein
MEQIALPIVVGAPFEFGQRVRLQLSWSGKTIANTLQNAALTVSAACFHRIRVLLNATPVVGY